MSLSPQSQPPSSSPPTTTTTVSDVHSDVLLTHILNRLDGPTLAAASCASTDVHSLSTTTANQHLWSNLCESTWHSTTTTPRIRHLVSAFPPHGPRSFFSASFPLLENLHRPSSSSSSSASTPPVEELISAVDIHYQNNLVFSKVQETETLSGWFRCSPFRIDLLDPKDVVVTPVKQPEDDVTCEELSTDLTLSWILIDSAGRRSVNLSSHKPVSVERHWLSGEVEVRYASILTVDRNKEEFVQCGIVVTCGGSEEGEMQVREVSLQVEGMEGMHLNGEDSLVILQAALEGKKGRREKIEEEAKNKYDEFLERKRERIERKMMMEKRFDTLCVGFGITIVSTFLLFISCT